MRRWRCGGAARRHARLRGRGANLEVNYGELRAVSAINVLYGSTLLTGSWPGFRATIRSGTAANGAIQVVTSKAAILDTTIEGAGAEISHAGILVSRVGDIFVPGASKVEKFSNGVCCLNGSSCYLAPSVEMPAVKNKVFATQGGVVRT